VLQTPPKPETLGAAPLPPLPFLGLRAPAAKPRLYATPCPQRCVVAPVDLPQAASLRVTAAAPSAVDPSITACPIIPSSEPTTLHSLLSITIQTDETLSFFAPPAYSAFFFRFILVLERAPFSLGTAFRLAAPLSRPTACRPILHAYSPTGRLSISVLPQTANRLQLL
jgi:hypothetical protein